MYKRSYTSLRRADPSPRGALSRMCVRPCVITYNSNHLHPERVDIEKHAYKYEDMGQTRRNFPRYAKILYRVTEIRKITEDVRNR